MNYTFTPPYAFKAQCLLNEAQVQTYLRSLSQRYGIHWIGRRADHGSVLDKAAENKNYTFLVECWQPNVEI
jgi:hypothetical protein